MSNLKKVFEMLKPFLNKKVLIIVLCLFIVMIVTNPGLIGLSVYNNNSCELSLNQIKLNFSRASGEASACKAAFDKVSAGINDCVDKYALCSTEYVKLGDTFNSTKTACEETILKLQEAVNSLQTQKTQEVESLKLQYQNLIRNMANSQCCKAKFDNPNIGFFGIANERIVCLEQGDYPINCDLGILSQNNVD
ncbi:MAG: hypothetical protein ABIH82_05655 [Candidatus Woesearchaeota archaeon]